MEETSTPHPGDEVRQIVNQALQAARQETEAGNCEQAGALYQAVLELQPGHAGACYGLGMLARQGGQLAGAIAHFAAALQGDPGDEACWLAYIDTLIEARQFTSAGELIELGRRHGLQGPAIDGFARQLAASGTPQAAVIDAATALFAQGRVDEAGNAACSLIDQFPQHAFGWKLLGAVHHLKGDLAQALPAMRTAMAHAPEDAETLSNLGLVLVQSGQLAEASNVLQRSLALQPDSANAHNHLALALMEMGRLVEAHASASAALALDPGHDKAGNSLAVILQNLGRQAEAVEVYRSVLACNPDHTDTHSNMLFCMSQMSEIGPDQLLAEHRLFGRQLASRIAPRRAWDNSPAPLRALRVGFVSGDFRQHAVTTFVEPLFERLAGRPGLVLHAYYNHPLHDAVTERLHGHFAHWRDVSGLDDATLDALIRADGIDILFDLSGHTAHNRLPLFARKPAPLQASWIGYPGTTGLDAIDYYFTVSKFLPPGQFDRLFTEKLVRLPLFVPFQPVMNAPDIAPLPALANGHITFGSFNRPGKFGRSVVALWGRVLRALPDARLILAGMPEHGGREQILSWLEQEGVGAERVDVHGRSSLLDYLALHNQVDICLDTFPYSGGTTTLHALWMGVPTLTLEGGTVPGRQTASCLEQWGLQQFIAHDGDEFVARAVAACGDLATLARLRLSMRAGFSLPSSETMTQVADGVEHALRLMWGRWCAGLPAAAFEVPLSACEGAGTDRAPGYRPA